MSRDDFHKQPTSPGVPGSKKPVQEIEIPKQVGPYKIESLLEKGGMSLLYLATDPETKAPITIKVVSPKYAQNQEVVDHFLKEAKIIKMADHPNIVKLYDVGQWEGGLYLAMEFIEGITLRQYILQHPSISLRLALELIIDISYALCHLHTHGVIHRDLKPENILITKEDQIKVIDFGIAQLLTKEKRAGHPSRMRLIGTPIYMSPEQRENPENVSFPSDIYSLGIIAYELIMGKLCHGRVKLSLMPKGVQEILVKTLQPKPEHRYQDAVDFITDLSHFLKKTILKEEKEMTEQLSIIDNVRDSLTPQKIPDWPGISIGLTSDSGSSNYYDFFTIDEKSFSIVMGESYSPGVGGIINTSYVRAMVRALHKQATPPHSILKSLNDLLVQDRLGPVFSLNYLLLSPNINKLEFISCGQGLLWLLKKESRTPQKLTSDNEALGINTPLEVLSKKESWEKGDRLLIYSFAPQSHPGKKMSIDEQTFTQSLVSLRDKPPQECINTIIQTLNESLADASTNSFTLICIDRH